MGPPTRRSRARVWRSVSNRCDPDAATTSDVAVFLCRGGARGSVSFCNHLAQTAAAQSTDFRARKRNAESGAFARHRKIGNFRSSRRRAVGAFRASRLRASTQRSARSGRTRASPHPLGCDARAWPAQRRSLLDRREAKRHLHRSRRRSSAHTAAGSPSPVGRPVLFI